MISVINILAEWPQALPVVDESGKLLGMVTRAAVISALAVSNPSGDDDGADETDTLDRSENA